MKTSPIPKLLLTAMFTVTGGIPAIGSAAINTSPHDGAETVAFSDLDLTREEGVQTLYQRLRASAHRVCGSPAGRELMEKTLQRRQCFDVALSKAVRDVDNRRLSDLHASQAS